MATVQRLYLLLPNHKCPNKKNCPFHPPEEQLEEEEAEVQIVSKRRAMSLASHEDRLISEQLLAEKLAKINQQIATSLVDGNKLHCPRKTSHDITLPLLELEHLKSQHAAYEESLTLPGSTREESVASDYDSTMTLDSGVMFDSYSDRDMEVEEELLPLIQEEIIIPDFIEPKQTEYVVWGELIVYTHIFAGIAGQHSPHIHITSCSSFCCSLYLYMQHKFSQFAPLFYVLFFSIVFMNLISPYKL